MMFELILTILTLITGLFGLTYWLIKKYRPALLAVAPAEPIPQRLLRWFGEQAWSFFPVFLFVLIFRSFLFEPFHIPSGSLKPTLLIGDYVLVNKFTYGLRLPVSHTKILNINAPKRGDIVVFRYPLEPSVDFIKRVIGLPGDHVRYQNKMLYINNQLVPQTFIKYTADDEDNLAGPWPLVQKQEDLLGIKHDIFQRPDVPAHDGEYIVPPGHYFVMGDNRDGSSDSRAWGFVPEENLAGKALLIWFSWDSLAQSLRDKVRWNRLGSFIH